MKERHSYNSALKAKLYIRSPYDVKTFLTKNEVRLHLKNHKGFSGMFVRLRLVLQGKTIKFPYEDTRTFPSQKLLAQLMLVAP